MGRASHAESDAQRVLEKTDMQAVQNNSTDLKIIATEKTNDFKSQK